MADVLLVGNGDKSWNSFGGANVSTYQKFTAVLSGNQTVIKLKPTGPGHAKVAIFSDNAGTPGAMLGARNDGAAVVAGWNDIALAGISITVGSIYWLAYNVDVNMSRIGSGGINKYKIESYASCVFASNPTGLSNDVKDLAIASWGTVAGGVGLIGDGLTGDQVFFGCEKFFG